MAKALKHIRPNAGLAVAYRKRLDKEIEAMHASLMRFLAATALRDQMARLGRRWRKRFVDLAPKLAAHFATLASERVDARLKATLREAGLTVEFKLTQAQRDAYQAVLAENVSLIKSVAEKHLTDVEGAVMRSVAAGRDLGQLTQALEKNYGVTRRRAAFIARSQNNMATAVLTRVRQEQAGITKARWLHTAGGKHTRKSHIKTGQNKTVYNVSEGCYDPEAGEHIWPGQLPNCRCVSAPVIDALA